MRHLDMELVNEHGGGKPDHHIRTWVSQWSARTKIVEVPAESRRRQGFRCQVVFPLRARTCCQPTRWATLQIGIWWNGPACVHYRWLSDLHQVYTLHGLFRRWIPSNCPRLRHTDELHQHTTQGLQETEGRGYSVWLNGAIDCKPDPPCDSL